MQTMMIVMIIMINPLKRIDEHSIYITTYLPSKKYEDLNDVSRQIHGTETMRRGLQEKGTMKAHLGLGLGHLFSPAKIRMQCQSQRIAKT